MSYEIIYDKQFIKLPKDNFVPMLYGGSNNCYEYSPSGKERRERSWFDFSWITNGNGFATMQQMLNFAEEEKERKRLENEARDRDGWYEEFNEKHWGYWCSLQIGSSTRGTTFGMYKGMLRTGCKKALTVEQLKEEGVVVNAHTYSSNETREKLQEKGLEEINFYPSNSQELLDFLETTYKEYREKGFSVHISYSGMYDEKPKRLRQKYFPKTRVNKSKELIYADNYFTIALEDGNYFVRKTKWGYKYTYTPYKKFLTEKEAKTQLNTLKRKYPSLPISVKEINSPIKVGLYV